MVLAARSPADCFDTAVEAARIATRFMTPVIMLTDATLSNGSQPWRVPTLAELPDATVTFATGANNEDGGFWPFLRDVETLARPWAIPGTPGLEHRIGGLEKLDGPGTPSHDAGNHEHMVQTRAAKIEGIARTLPPLEVADPSAAEGDPAEVLVLGWGSSYGPVEAACRRLRRSGVKVAHAHLRHLHPFPPGVEEALNRYRKVIVPELNLGQLSTLLQAKFCVRVTPLTQVRGAAFRAEDLVPILKEEIER